MTDLQRGTRGSDLRSYIVTAPDGIPSIIVRSDKEYIEALEAEIDRLSAPDDPDLDPEARCHRCGGPNRPWYAPSPLWNAVMRGGSINGPWEYDEIICPTCFMVLAEERGIAQSWRLDAREVHVELELVTPSGRVWDATTDLWRDADD